MTYLFIFLIGLWTLVSPVRATGTRYIDMMFPTIDITRDIQYGEAPSLRTSGKEKLLLDIYQPSGDSEMKRAAILWVHGGSFFTGSKELYGQGGNLGSAQIYASRGYVSIPINYRLEDHAVTPKSSDIGVVTQQAKYDVLAAVRWVRAHAPNYRIDPDRIILAGSSAGAWTSLYAAYDTTNVGTSGTPQENSSVAAVVSFAGGMSANDLAVIESGMPPAIFLHGATDAIVPIGLPTGVYNRLKTQGIPTEFHTYPGGHGAPNNTDADEKVRNFLVTTLKLNRAVYVADLDDNDKVNIIDFTLLMNYWFQNDITKIDFNSDGKISVIDYTIFMNSWYDYLKSPA